MPPDFLDRRSEERPTQTGQVQLSFDDPLHHDISAPLLDISKTGFRATHAYPALSPGQLVSFEHATAQGTARVIWTGIIEGKIESGFFVF